MASTKFSTFLSRRDAPAHLLISEGGVSPGFVPPPRLRQAGLCYAFNSKCKSSAYAKVLYFSIVEWQYDHFLWRVLQSPWTSRFFPYSFPRWKNACWHKKKVISRNETGELGRKPRKNNNSYLNVVFQDFDVRLLENLAELLMDKRKDKLLAGFLTHPPVQRQTLGNVQPQFVQSTESQQGQTIYYDTNKKLSRAGKKMQEQNY